jgi:transposase-like protein
MSYCKHCGSGEVRKHGVNEKGKQRYRCKECSRTSCEGDDRLKHGMDKRIKVIKMVLEGVGIRSIERLEGVSNPLIIYWIRHFAEIVRKELRQLKIPDNLKNIEILEVDELFTFVQKKPNELMYGLLLTETEIKLLMLK